MDDSIISYDRFVGGSGKPAQRKFEHNSTSLLLQLLSKLYNSLPLCLIIVSAVGGGESVPKQVSNDILMVSWISRVDVNKNIFGSVCTMSVSVAVEVPLDMLSFFTCSP